MTANKFSCYVIGGDSLLIECSELLLAQGHELRGIITLAPRLEQWAKKRGVTSIKSDADYRTVMAERPFDYLFAITHLSILPDDVISLPKRGAINFHDGPLPRYAGLYTPAWALIHREPRYGITWHLMTPGVDEGDILKQREFDVAPQETSLTINTRCFEIGIDTFAELTGELAAGTEQRTVQDRAQRSYFGKHARPAAACMLDLSRSAAELEALVRALDFGQYENPLGLPKLTVNGRVFVATRAELSDAGNFATPGTVISVAGDAMTLATGDGALTLSGFHTLAGEAIPVQALADELALRPGSTIEPITAKTAERLNAWSTDLAKSESNWMRRLVRLDPVEIPYASTDAVRGAAGYGRFEVAIPDVLRTSMAHSAPADVATALAAAFLSRLGGKSLFDVAYSDVELTNKVTGLEAWVATRVPLRLDAPPEVDVRGLGDRLATELARVRRWGSYMLDAPARKPELRGRPELRSAAALPIGIAQRADLEGFTPPLGSVLTIVVPSDGRRLGCMYDKNSLGAREARALQGQLQAFLDRLAEGPAAAIGDVPLLSAEDETRVLVTWNDTKVDYRRDVCVHQLFEEQAARTPEAVAVIFEGQPLTYRALNERSNRLAAYLRELGVGPDRLVGVCVERSLELIVSILAVQKAGGAYVPLDPAYPADRIAFMIEDSAVSVLLTNERLLTQLPAHNARVVCVDADAEIEKRPATNPQSGVRSEHLAYVIYTSGSTGKPKGVMVEHRNVVNFFRGMDPVIAHEPPGVWLAVTSLSFDISVLELFWTLSHGFTLVVFLDRERGADAHATGPQQKIDFSIFMWGADDQATKNKYGLMLDAARFGDARGFSAMWTPERHFHAFGGPYPNPSVTGAAIAAVTSKLQVRAGSCVVPLHHPARVAEEWAVVDNISRGRVGVSFAAGWQPDDFLLRPENFKDAKRILTESVDTVRRLWRGEKLSFPGPLGKPVEIVTQPRPVQAELPYWVTTAGNQETYRLAGAMGANVLTHLLGQTIEEVATKIEVYRQARQDAGLDPATGIVSLMLHTFVGTNLDEVRELVREPMKSYLRSSVALIKNFAWAFPAFKRPQGEHAKPEDIDLGSLTTEEMDAILDYAFERYFETSGLFGTYETCLQMVERCRAAGVDDIACLIDFGVPTSDVLAGLEHLDVVRKRANLRVGAKAAQVPVGDFSLPAQGDRHKVTHMQCTPSMARMLLVSDAGRGALRSLKHLMVGGEAFPVALAKELSSVMRGSITNMYGPTETTIWSSTHRLEGATDSIPIGRPIANTQLYVLDARQKPLPIGVPGELYIGGDGVVRGYLGRPELTAERFVRDPIRNVGNARMYRTGDVARFRDDGVVEFLGRADHQVKIRGYRIELGEIETLLNRHPAVAEGVVLAREDTPGDQRLVAYLVAEGTAPSAAELRDFLREKLPEYMVPAHVVVLERMPLTPNGKTDRKALPRPEAIEANQPKEYVPPAGDLEETIAAAWRETLGVTKVGTRDNFFDLGGHSLLVVRLHRRLVPLMPRPLSLTDLYRFPTIASLCEFITADPSASKLAQSEDRAKLRLDLQKRRRRGREA